TTTAGAPPSVAITATRIISNSGLAGGGVLFADANSAGRSVSIAGSLFAGNTVALGLTGRDVTLDNTLTTVRNTTFVDAPGVAPALAASNSTVGVRNSIFRGYGAGVLAPFSAASITSNFNLFTIAPASVVTGSSSLINDPLFVNPGAGDYRLQPISPAVDAGNDADLPASLTSDLDGLPRQVNGNPTRPALVDMGAFEMQLLAPTAVANGPYGGFEGTPVALDATGSSGSAPLAFGWDCTNNGSVDVNGALPTGLACTYADNGPALVRLVVTNSVGVTTSSIAPVAIANVAPSVSAGPAGQFAGVTLPTTVTIGSFTDPGLLDFPWSLGVNWGDNQASGPILLPAQGVLPPLAHTYPIAGTQTITVTVTDKDGDSGQATFARTVDPTPNPLDDSATLAVGKQILIPVLSNDNGEGIFLSAVGLPDRGTAVIEGAAVRYTAPATIGSDFFTYTVTDRNGAAAQATVTISVTGGP
ncbi:MAG: Ig-like domain-containing protein, partial [Caldilineaceae bacterium]